LAWLGVALVGAAAWLPLGTWLLGPAVGVGLAAGWVLGYGFYEFQHAQAHLRAPRNRYERWLRKHHFHHHFGHPMANHGVTIPFWDIVFRTREAPDVVPVPRRLAAGLGWLLDDDGELRAEFAADYVLVGIDRMDERQAGIDRARRAGLPRHSPALSCTSAVITALVHDRAGFRTLRGGPPPVDPS